MQSGSGTTLRANGAVIMRSVIGILLVAIILPGCTTEYGPSTAARPLTSYRIHLERKGETEAVARECRQQFAGAEFPRRDTARCFYDRMRIRMVMIMADPSGFDDLAAQDTKNAEQIDLGLMTEEEAQAKRDELIKEADARNRAAWRKAAADRR